MDTKIFHFVAPINGKCEEDQSIPIASERGDLNISTRRLKHANRKTWLTDSVPLMPQKSPSEISHFRFKDGLNIESKVAHLHIFSQPFPSNKGEKQWITKLPIAL